MIEADVADRAGQRLDDVGRVQPPAQADFYHRRVNLPLGKPGERDVRQDFKISGRTIRKTLAQRVEHRHAGAQDAREIGFWNPRSINRAAFAHVLQMRRDIQPDAAAVGAQHRGREGAGRTFAFRAGDVQAVETPPGFTERARHVAHGLQRKRGARSGQRRFALVVYKSVEVGKRLPIIHEGQMSIFLCKAISKISLRICLVY